MKKDKKKSQRPERRPVPPMTFGHVLGEAWEQKKAEDRRRAELNDMGFKPLKGA